ncbi:MAG: ComF family protein [Gammaproteobacteria bacterium]
MNMDVIRLAAGMCQRLVTTVYPPCCVLCGAPGCNGMDICAACYRHLPWIDQACSQCAIPIAAEPAGALKCGQCLRKPPAFDYSLSLFRYQDDAIKLIQQLKFNEKLANSRLLGSMLAAVITDSTTALPDCIVPVPLHYKRLRQRGFNQSTELGRVAGKACKIPLSSHAVMRVRDTRSQTGLDKRQRHNNIRGAFEIRQALDAEHVAILDDVVTTTSTVNELARLLKKAGVRRVDVWSIARAV